MKKLYVISFLVMTVQLALSQGSFYTFIDSVNKISIVADKIAFVESLVQHLDTVGTPLIEGDTANFIYYGEATSVEIAGDFNAWGGSGTWLCENISETNFYYFSQTFEPTARLDYKFIINGSNWILDPLNPNTVSGGFGPNSELAMPAYVQPWEIESFPDVAKGTIETLSLKSEVLNKNFSIQIYLPPGYNPGQRYPTVYVHDGHEYIGLGSMNHVMDNLLDSNLMDPVIGVFIRPINRNDEYAGAERFDYAQFIAQTVVTYVDENYSTMADKKYRLTMGASYGGNISGLIAFTYPEVFGNSGWHSPALWANNGEVASMFAFELKDVKLYFNMGTYENLGVDWDLFTEKITGLGYEYEWHTYHEGHSWGLWRATTDDILKYFFPKGSTPVSIENKQARGFSMGQNHPNPFYTLTTIPLMVGSPGDYHLSVYNVLGQTVFSNLLRYNLPGSYTINMDARHLNKGVYLYVIETKNLRISRQMIVQ